MLSARTPYFLSRWPVVLMAVGCLVAGACGGITLGSEARDPGCAANPGGPGALVGLAAESGERLWDTKLE